MTTEAIMNFSIECNSLIISNSNSSASMKADPGNQEATSDLTIKEESFDFGDQNWTFLPLETSPIFNGPRSKVVRKRKKRVNWSKSEDDYLSELVKGYETYELKWPQIAIRLNMVFEASRTGKQCRERWLNSLRPNIKKGAWTHEEEIMIDYFHKTFGPKWSTMAKLMKNRTDNDIKNKWNSMKRMEKAGRKRKMPQTYDAISDTNVVEKQAKKQFHADKWIETGGCDTHSSNHKIQVRTSEEIPCLKFSPTPAIIPTVTDGISKESSPIVKKIRWKYEV